MKKKLLLVTWGLIMALVLVIGYILFIKQTNKELTPGNQNVSLGEEFTLHVNQAAIIENENYEIKIIEFINSPCPEGVQCIWSGIGIAFEYTYNGEIKKGMNLVQAFGYQTTIIDTDNETFAKLKIEKME